MPADWHKPAIERMAATVADNAALLTELDSAIGDGDHGNNMKRGFDAAAAIADELAAMATGPALQKLGMTLVTKVGGASGPLYGSLFMQMGKALGERALDRDTLAESLAAGIAAVETRGKAAAGEKTMLDVLGPVHRSLAAGAAPAAIAETAAEALAATREMKATKGRAAYLGDRSIGHLDPGAQSAALLITTLCTLAEEHA